MKHVRKVIRDKKTDLPKRYLSGVRGKERQELARIIKQISDLYKAGKRIPQSLINRRIELGRKR
jgi:cobyrinic acid a,c-diamide synthase